MCPINTGNIANILKIEPPSKEEIKVFREKNLCLVCKGEAIGFNAFICPTCNVLYCEKCARALILLENACWVCKGKFDPAKPVNPFNEEGFNGKSLKKSKKGMKK